MSPRRNDNDPANVPVESSNIKAIGYQPSTKKLFVRFKNNTLYEYADVPQSTFDELSDAHSKGQYFSRSIRNVFEASKVEELLTE